LLAKTTRAGVLEQGINAPEAAMTVYSGALGVSVLQGDGAEITISGMDRDQFRASVAAFVA
jgi:hypothetical protein